MCGVGWGRKRGLHAPSPAGRTSLGTLGGRPGLGDRGGRRGQRAFLRVELNPGYQGAREESYPLPRPPGCWGGERGEPESGVGVCTGQGLGDWDGEWTAQAGGRGRKGWRPGCIDERGAASLLHMGLACPCPLKRLRERGRAHR